MDAPLLRQELESQGRVVLTPRGNSMWPLLHDGRDSVSLVRLEGAPKRGDIVLFVRDNSECVLHRIIAVREGECDFLGDGQLRAETVRADQLLARADAIWRGEKPVRLTGLGYRLYVALWCGSLGRGLRPEWLRAAWSMWTR